MAVLAVVAGAAPAAADLAGRLELDFIDERTGEPLPPSVTSVGGETRPLVAPSGRVRLTLMPVQVATGGRVFVYSDVPRALSNQDLRIEVFLRENGKWIARRSFVREAGKVGRVSLTLVVPDLEPGPIVAAMFAEPFRAYLDTRDVTAAVRVPGSARLRIGYSIDRMSWDGVAPVELSVYAQGLERGEPAGARVELFSRRVEPSKLAPQWFEEDISLSQLSGRDVQLVFLTRQTASKKAAPATVAWTRPRVVYDSASKRRPSVIVVSVDGLRAASMGCCGGTRETTPFIDGLFGEQGIVFDRALTQAATSTAAHMTLLTGLYPSVHGVLSERDGLARDADTMAEAFRSAGYATAGFTGGGDVAAEFGFADGFDVYYEDPDTHVGKPEGTVDSVVARATQWLEIHSGEPVFVFIHLNQVRYPYVPPPTYLDAFTDGRLDRESKLDEGALVRYEREIRYVNDQFDLLSGKLDKLSDPRSTVLVLTSGHGTEFLEHEGRGAGTHLYDETVRVPLMMRGSDLRPAVRYAEMIGLVDVMPTLLELTGVRIDADLQGQSVAGALRSGLPFQLPPRFSEAHASVRLLKDAVSTKWEPPAFAMHEGFRKLIMYTVGDKTLYEAYDLNADPDETNDLIKDGKGPKWATEMMKVLKNYPVACEQVARPVHRDPPINYEARVKIQRMVVGSKVKTREPQDKKKQ